MTLEQGLEDLASWLEGQTAVGSRSGSAGGTRGPGTDGMKRAPKKRDRQGVPPALGIVE